MSKSSISIFAISGRTKLPEPELDTQGQSCSEEEDFPSPSQNRPADLKKLNKTVKKTDR